MERAGSGEKEREPETERGRRRGNKTERPLSTDQTFPRGTHLESRKSLSWKLRDRAAFSFSFSNLEI